MFKLIPTKVHGVIDYLFGIAFLAAPQIFRWGERETFFALCVAILSFVYALFTRYELGLFKVIPMKVHLLVDFGMGVLLLMSPLIIRHETAEARYFLLGAGLFAFMATILTQTEPKGVKGTPYQSPQAKPTS